MLGQTEIYCHPVKAGHNCWGSTRINPGTLPIEQMAWLIFKSEAIYTLVSLTWKQHGMGPKTLHKPMVLHASGTITDYRAFLRTHLSPPPPPDANRRTMTHHRWKAKMHQRTADADHKSGPNSGSIFSTTARKNLNTLQSHWSGMGEIKQHRLRSRAEL